jgi:hypothetical protein
VAAPRPRTAWVWAAVLALVVAAIGTPILRLLAD